ncbi:creatininase family protein [candidate division WOR-3 bacterium]|nr:creatininase family protein [candidate division WOR-3 bacterium]
MERRLLNLNNRQLSEKLKEDSIDTVILPVGTIESHGVTPLGTDVIIPEKIALDICNDLNAIVAPTISYGLTKGLLPHKGSMTLSETTFENILFDVALSLKRIGFRKVVIINGHGGNINSIKNAQYRIYKEIGLYSVTVNWWILCSDIPVKLFGKTGGHAAVDETAMIQAIDPELVHWEYLCGVEKFRPFQGVDSIPYPSNILVYDELGGEPVDDEVLSKKFYEKVVSRVSEVSKQILESMDSLINSNLLS